jgi:hypothetical protein
MFCKSFSLLKSRFVFIHLAYIDTLEHVKENMAFFFFVHAKLDHDIIKKTFFVFIKNILHPPLFSL